MAERDSGRNRPVVVVIGDGSLQYSIQGLWTAVQHKLPILFVVARNGEYAILKSFAELENSPGVPGLDLPGLDIVSLAKGYGCISEKVETPDAIRKVCSEAFSRDVPDSDRSACHSNGSASVITPADLMTGDRIDVFSD